MTSVKCGNHVVARLIGPGQIVAHVCAACTKSKAAHERLRHCPRCHQIICPHFRRRS